MKPDLFHTRSVRRHFDRAAAAYSAGATIQREAARRLLRELHSMPPPERILEAGCGSGILTALLTARYPAASIEAFDLSERMLAAAQASAPASSRILWRRMDFEQCALRPEFDWVVSSSSLHWAADLPRAIAALAAGLAPSGTLAVSLMLKGTLRELHTTRAAIAPDAAPHRTMPEQTELQAAVESAGLFVLRADCYTLTAEHASAAALLRDLHNMGLTGGTQFRPSRLLTRTEIEKLRLLYDQRYRIPGGVAATYEIGWILAKKSGE